MKNDDDTENDHMANDFDAPELESRGMTSPLGKYTGGRLRTDVDDDTYHAWLTLCAERNVTSAELLRDLVYLVVHGLTPAEMAAKDRRGLLRGTGPDEARARIGGGGR